MQVILQKPNYFHFLKGIKKQFLFLFILATGVAMNCFAQPPVNDEPCNAIPLNSGLTCNSQQFTNLDATASAGVPAPGCANYLGGDVWFTVVVPPGNGTLDFDLQAAGITDGGMAVYRGTCGNLQLIECDDDDGPALLPSITLASLTPGTTLWIRVWEYGGNGNGTFGICVTDPGPPPSYDEPCTATALPDPTTVCTYQTFSNAAATTSTTTAPAPGCATYAGNDVWFTVLVPAASNGVLKFDTDDGDMTDGGMAIYSGPDCNNLTLIACDDDASPNGLMPQIIQANLTIGSTIWIRVWGKGNVPGNNGTFGLCVSIPPPPPANDEPCNAIQLSASNTCTYNTYTTQSASSTSGVPAPGCANYQGGDVWFKVTVPCDGKITIDTDEGVITDGGMAAYRGVCGNLQLIECDDDDSPNDALMPMLNLSSLTPGSTIYIRVWEYGNDNPGTFKICASIPPPPPVGGNCLGAQSFCSSNTYTYPNSQNVPSLGGGGIYGCLGSTPNPAWYYFQVQTAGDISILIQQTNTAGNLVDVDFALWGPFADLPASCGNLAATNIVSCSYSTSGTETAVLTNAQVGQVYVLLITNFSNQAGTVVFQQTAGTGGTNCNIVCNLTAGNSGPVCPSSFIDLTATTVVGATYQWTGPNCFNQLPGSTTQNPTGVQVPSEPGTYIYTVTATTPPPTGTTCFAQTSVVVLAPQPIGNDTTIYICSGVTKDLTTVYVGAASLVTSAWYNYPAGTPVADPTTIATSGVYQIIGAGTNTCPDTAYVTLVVDQVTFTAQQTGQATCTVPGEITVLNAVGIGAALEYILDGGAPQSSNIFVADAGPHDVTVRDSIGCETTLTVIVDFDNNLTVNVSSNATICLNQSTTLNATASIPTATYAWLPATGLNDPTSGSPVASPTDATTYTVTATQGACTATGTVTVNVDNDLTVEAGGPITINAGSNQQVTAVVTGTNTSLSSILWTPSAGLSATNVLNPVVTPVIVNGTTVYDITVTNTNGCTASDELTVNVVSDIACRNLRNAFTPNGDGQNDFWLVYDDFSCLQNVAVSVFNRYGSKVFDSKSYKNEWNGTFEGKAVPDGTYYAVVTYTMAFTGKVITVKTDLTVLR